MSANQSFTASQRNSIEALRGELSASTHHAVTTEYGSTDCGQHWAALCVEELPVGSWGTPGPLVTIVTGARVKGGLGCFGVLGFDGIPIAEGVELNEATRAAEAAGLLAWLDITASGLV
jgi:hypothetical protein